MGIISLLLLERADAGDSPEAMLAVAESLLANSSVVATDAAGTAHADAMSAFRSLEVICRNAFRRYPAPTASPDARALALAHTLTMLRDRGFYDPAELAAIGEPGSTGWAASECIRLHALVIVLKAAIRDLESGTLDAGAYGDAVSTVVQRFASITIARNPASRDS